MLSFKVIDIIGVNIASHLRPCAKNQGFRALFLFIEFNEI